MEAYGMVWDLSWIPVTASGLALVVFDVSGKVFLYLEFITGVGVFQDGYSGRNREIARNVYSIAYA